MNKTVRIMVILLLLFDLFALTANAAGNSAEDQYVTGMEYFDRQDYDHAFSYFQISGEIKGYAPAQNMLGICYRDGLGTEQDYSEAEKYFILSSEQGYSEAGHNLAALSSEKEEAREEEYQKAMDLYFNSEYEDAAVIFRSLGNYEHSLNFLALCGKAMEQAEWLEEQNRSDPTGVSEKPAPPQIQSVTFDEKNRPIITWDAVDGAASYRLFRSSDNNHYDKLVDLEETTYTSNSYYTVWKTYYFKVLSVSQDGIESEYSDAKKVTIPLGKPQITSIKQDDSGAPVLNWRNVSSASSYKIFRSEDDGYYSIVDRGIKGLNYTDKSAGQGKTYYYKIRAVDINGKESELSDAEKITVQLKATRTPTPKGYVGTAKGSWSGEKVYLNDSSTGIFELDEPIRNCRSLTMNQRFYNFEGHPEGMYYLYGRSESGHWNQLGEFELSSNKNNTRVKQTFEFKEEKHVSITAFAIALHERNRAYTGSWSFSNSMEITDVYVYE